jgi:hypothetical protein
MHRVAMVMPNEANRRAILTTGINKICSHYHTYALVHKTPHNIIWFVHILFNVWQWDAAHLLSFHHTQLKALGHVEILARHPFWTDYVLWD